MGKTKTAFVSGFEEEDKSSLDKLKEKREKQAAAAKAKASVEKVHISGLKGGQRIKTIDAGPIIEEAVPQETEFPASVTPTEVSRSLREPKTRSKKYQKAKAIIDQTKSYSLKEAIDLVRKSSYSKFDGTMELHLLVKKIGIGAQVDMPYSTGKVKKIEIAGEKTIEKLEAASSPKGSGPVGKIDFDILVATPDMMPKLVPFAKLLGPKGLMPNPKDGTLLKDAKKAASFSASRVSLKTEKEAPLIHTTIGKLSQKDTELTANLEAIIAAVGEKQILKTYLKATMSPSVKLQIKSAG